MELDRMEVMHNQDKIQSSFSSINGLLKNTESLKEVLGYIKQAGLNKDKEFLHSHQKSEADEILTNLGVIDVVTKDEEGNLDSFYLKTVRLINEIFSTKGIQEKKGNIMSLIDMYLYYNRLMGMNLITPDDLLKACRLFEKIKSPLELKELESGVKVIQFRSHDPRKDFKEFIYPYLEAENGLSCEDLAKKSGASLIVAKLRLQDNYKMGSLVLDNSLEGKRYFINDIITCKLQKI